MSSPLHGRVFHRFRAYEKFSESITNQVTALWQDMEKNNVFSKHTNGISANELMATIEKSQQVKECAISPEQTVDALVLGGFLALAKESKASSTQTDNFAASEHAKFITTTSKTSTPSVWDVHKGANQAGYVEEWTTSRSWIGIKRENSTKVYAVVNELQNHVYLFSDDAALSCNSTVPLINATVEYDIDENRHAVTITTADHAHSRVVTLGLPSKADQEEWCNSIINAGARYREMYNISTESVKSIYELKDRDMQGNEVSMEKYKGKVLLIVNVSSLCGLTPINYPELTTLYNKYRNEGLEILAFPCNQFKSQEPGTHEEIMEFVKQYGCEFPFFEKADVNGKFARPVFTYLKAKLPGSFGNFVKWNFTKFLVDHTGQPYKRFSPRDKPLTFEDEIQYLLQKRNSDSERQPKL